MVFRAEGEFAGGEENGCDDGASYGGTDYVAVEELGKKR
jgi:hypothetical protein